MHLAYDFKAWPINTVTRFLRLWAAREYGVEYSHEIADIMGHYSVCPTTFYISCLITILWVEANIVAIDC